MAYPAGRPRGPQSEEHRRKIGESMRNTQARKTAASAYVDLINVAMASDRADLVMEVLHAIRDDPSMGSDNAEVIDKDGMHVVAWQCYGCHTINQVTNSTCECCGKRPKREVFGAAPAARDVNVAQQNLLNQIREAMK
jgi:hypothetical protein